MHAFFQGRLVSLKFVVLNLVFQMDRLKRWYFFLQVRGYFDRQINKLKSDGAFITDKIDEDHARLVEQIFEAEDKNKDGVISHDEFSGQKHDEL